MFAERRKGALHQEGLTGTEHHDRGPPSLRPTGTARIGCPTGGLRIGVGRAGRLGSGCRLARAAHQRRVFLVIRRDGRLDDALVLAVLVLLPVDLAHELDAIEICESANAARVLRGRTVVAGMNPTRGVEDRLDEGATHVGPLRPLGAVQADQRPHLATGELTLHHDELAVQVDRAGVVVTGGVAASPSLGRVIEATRADGHADADQRALGDQVIGRLFGCGIEIEVGHDHDS